MARGFSASRSAASGPAPLAGIRVLDLTRILSGPFCTMKLGDMGAEVIKIEQPPAGDDTRRWGPPFLNGESAYFLSVNRNKKSVGLDLKSDEGKKILARLLRSSDVLVENFRTGVMEKLGFGYASVSRTNPRIVYCSISGYGRTSSRSHKPSYDLIVQGESGLMDMTGFPGGPPTKTGISLADVNAGNMAFEGILLALLRRTRTGGGGFVDISLLDGLLSLFAYQSQIALLGLQRVGRKGNRHPTITPYETYETKDGFMNVSVGSEAHWKAFCAAIGMPALASDPRFSSNAGRVGNRTALEKVLTRALRSKRTSSWLRAFAAADVPSGTINTLSGALDLPVVRERGLIVGARHPSAGFLKMVGNPIRLSPARRTAVSPPPLLGQHTDAVLKRIGYSRLRISGLRRRGVVV